MSKKPLKPLGAKQGLGTLVKARFGAGMLLQHDDLDALATYTQELNRLMFRTLFGCGVMCGLVVSVDPPKCGKLSVRVAKGVALDSCGDPIAVNETQTILLDTECDPQFPTTLWVLLCAKFKCCAPRTSLCGSDGDDDAPSVSTRERYGHEIRVVAEPPECACGCDPDDELKASSACRCFDPERSCYRAHYSGDCAACDCSGGSSGGCGGDCAADCGCDCVVLAKLDLTGPQGEERWEVSHKVRRFIRPVLIDDPQARLEFEARELQASAAAANVGIAAEAQTTPAKLGKTPKAGKVG
jgi:hypothetical protein